jgi:hypothetical protein
MDPWKDYEIDLRDTLDDAFRRFGSVSNRQLQRAFRISRQAVWKRLRPLVDSGELAITGVGRGIRYVRGPGHGDFGGIVRGRPDPGDFWRKLGEALPALVYVSVRSAAARVSRRADFEALLGGISLYGRHLVLDFEGVPDVGQPFAEALYRQVFRDQIDPSGALLIHVSQAIQERLDRARFRDEMRPKSDYGE